MEYTNEKLCASCGGRCCKHYPGVSHPKDWGAPNRKMMHQKLKEAIATGRWCFDSWYGDPRIKKKEVSEAYFVRPSMKGNEGEIYHPGWWGVCALLGDSGCTLTYEKRPHQCQLLEPGKEECPYHGRSKRELIVSWLRYQDVVESILWEEE